MNNTKKITWYDLKTLCNRLTGEQLGKDVLIWGEEKGFVASGTLITEDDYINPSGDGLEPKYIYKDEPELLEEESVIVEKGHPILLIK